MAKPKYLWQTSTGRRYIYSEALAKRRDMVTFDPAKKSKDLPMKQDVPAPPGFLDLLKKCGTRQKVISLVKRELGVDTKLFRRLADQKADAKEIFKARRKLRKLAEHEEGMAQDETDLEHDSETKIHDDMAASMRAHVEAEEKAKAKADVKTDETGSTEK